MSYDASPHAVVPSSDFTSMQGHPTTRYWKIAGRSLEDRWTIATTERALPSSAVQLRCWSRPMTTTRLPLARDCTACPAWSRHTTTVKNDASRSLRPDTATRNPAERCRHLVQRTSGPRSGCRRSLRLPRSWLLPLPVAWPDGSCPALGPGGRWTPVACQETAGGKRQSQRSRPRIKVAGRGRLRCRVGWWGACGWGSGMPVPSGQIPPPWAW